MAKQRDTSPIGTSQYRTHDERARIEELGRKAIASLGNMSPEDVVRKLFQAKMIVEGESPNRYLNQTSSPVPNQVLADIKGSAQQILNFYARDPESIRKLFNTQGQATNDIILQLQRVIKADNFDMLRGIIPYETMRLVLDFPLPGTDDEWSKKLHGYLRSEAAVDRSDNFLNEFEKKSEATIQKTPVWGASAEELSGLSNFSEQSRANLLNSVAQVDSFGRPVVGLESQMESLVQYLESRKLALAGEIGQHFTNFLGALPATPAGGKSVAQKIAYTTGTKPVQYNIRGTESTIAGPEVLDQMAGYAIQRFITGDVYGLENIDTRFGRHKKDTSGRAPSAAELGARPREEFVPDKGERQGLLNVGDSRQVLKNAIRNILPGQEIYGETDVIESADLESGQVEVPRSFRGAPLQGTGNLAPFERARQALNDEVGLPALSPQEFEQLLAAGERVQDSAAESFKSKMDYVLDAAAQGSRVYDSEQQRYVTPDIYRIFESLDPDTGKPRQKELTPTDYIGEDLIKQLNKTDMTGQGLEPKGRPTIRRYEGAYGDEGMIPSYYHQNKISEATEGRKVDPNEYRRMVEAMMDAGARDWMPDYTSHLDITGLSQEEFNEIFGKFHPIRDRNEEFLKDLLEDYPLLKEQALRQAAEINAESPDWSYAEIRKLVHDYEREVNDGTAAEVQNQIQNILDSNPDRAGLSDSDFNKQIDLLLPGQELDRSWLYEVLDNNRTLAWFIADHADQAVEQAVPFDPNYDLPFSEPRQYEAQQRNAAKNRAYADVVRKYANFIRRGYADDLENRIIELAQEKVAAKGEKPIDFNDRYEIRKDIGIEDILMPGQDIADISGLLGASEPSPSSPVSPSTPQDIIRNLSPASPQAMPPMDIGLGSNAGAVLGEQTGPRINPDYQQQLFGGLPDNLSGRNVNFAALQEEIEAMNKANLAKIAKQLGVKGRSRMNKAALKQQVLDQIAQVAELPDYAGKIDRDRSLLEAAQESGLGDIDTSMTQAQMAQNMQLMQSPEAQALFQQHSAPFTLLEGWDPLAGGPATPEEALLSGWDPMAGAPQQGFLAGTQAADAVANEAAADPQTTDDVITESEGNLRKLINFSKGAVASGARGLGRRGLDLAGAIGSDAATIGRNVSNALPQPIRQTLGAGLGTAAELGLAQAASPIIPAVAMIRGLQGGANMLGELFDPLSNMGLDSARAAAPKEAAKFKTPAQLAKFNPKQNLDATVDLTGKVDISPGGGVGGLFGLAGDAYEFVKGAGEIAESKKGHDVWGLSEGKKTVTIGEGGINSMGDLIEYLDGNNTDGMQMKDGELVAGGGHRYLDKDKISWMKHALSEIGNDISSGKYSKPEDHPKMKQLEKLVGKAEGLTVWQGADYDEIQEQGFMPGLRDVFQTMEGERQVDELEADFTPVGTMYTPWWSERTGQAGSLEGLVDTLESSVSATLNPALGFYYGMEGVLGRSGRADTLGEGYRIAGPGMYTIRLRDEIDPQQLRFTRSNTNVPEEDDEQWLDRIGAIYDGTPYANYRYWKYNDEDGSLTNRATGTVVKKEQHGIDNYKQKLENHLAQTKELWENRNSINRVGAENKESEIKEKYRNKIKFTARDNGHTTKEGAGFWGSIGEAIGMLNPFDGDKSQKDYINTVTIFNENEYQDGKVAPGKIEPYNRDWEEQTFLTRPLSFLGENTADLLGNVIPTKDDEGFRENRKYVNYQRQIR